MILVSGATGNVGSALVRRLAEAAVPVRALARRAPATPFPRDVEVVTGDLTDSASLTAAFTSVDALFLFTPPAGASAAVDIARDAGVRHVVLLSSAATQKADPLTNPIAARHDAAEKAVKASGMTWTILRPDSFAANTLAWADSIRTHGLVRAAYPGSQRNPIHEEDLAAVAMRALLEPGYAGNAYLLTGPAAITQAEQASAIGDAIGRTIRFEELTRAEALAEMSQRTPPAIAERLLDYAAKSVHTAPSLSSAVADILGRPPQPFAQWARDRAAAFR